MSERMRIAATTTGMLMMASLLAGRPGSAESEPALRDPTRPPVRIEAEESPTQVLSEARDLDLQAVFIAPDRRIAIINDERLRERDRIAGARVLRIRPDRVVLRRAGRRFELELLSQPRPLVSSGPAAPASLQKTPSIERAEP